MEILVREVPEQHVVTERREVDRAALEARLPGAEAQDPVLDVAFPVTAGG